MQSLNDIQAVTFDVGGTLIHPFPSVGHIYAEVAARHGWKDARPETLNTQFALAWRNRRPFDHTRKAWSRLVDETFRYWLKPGESVPFFDDLYARFARAECWRVFDDVIPTLDLLNERGIELGIVSNWDERLRPLLGALRLDRYFRIIVISHEIGFTKPSPVIFEEATRKFACPVSSVLHVGDSETDDFEGAAQAGLQSLQLRRKAHPEVPHCLTSLAELPARLG